jgi:signal transduction histidine kinase
VEAELGMLETQINTLDRDRLILEQKLSIAEENGQSSSSEQQNLIFELQNQIFDLIENQSALEERRDALQSAEWKALEIENTRSEFQNIEQTKGLSFYVSYGRNTLRSADAAGDAATMIDAASVASAFKTHAAWLAYENGELSARPEFSPRYDGMKMDILRTLDPANYSAAPASIFSAMPTDALYLSFDGDFLAERSQTLQNARKQTLPWMWTFLAGLVLALTFFVSLAVTTGRGDGSGNVNLQLCAADRVFTELQLLTVTVVTLSGGYYLSCVADDQYYYGFWAYTAGRDKLVDLAFISSLAVPLTAIGLWFLLSLTRNLKARRFFQNALLWRLCRGAYRGIRTLFDKGNPMSKTVILALAVCVLSATVVLAPVMLALTLIFGIRQARQYAAVKRGVDEVKNGNLTWQIPTDEGTRGEFNKLARDINKISDASRVAIQNELKTQRLKTDLISNVSHDLKTPLTSIITYVDLLKKEGLDSPSAPEYLHVLDQKSQRLKKLTEDLFDAAKASSGAIPVRLERVDLLSLIRQGLGELNDGFMAQGLNVKLRFENEKHYVRADGQLLWRIVENLLVNAQKYALEGSRVYIDLTDQIDLPEEQPNQNQNLNQTLNLNQNGGMTTLEIKNISKAQLNISADELMERFARGDESRADGGSGLGLAIVRDLAKLQNGWFELKIDGDLFKAVLTLDRGEEAA